MVIWFAQEETQLPFYGAINFEVLAAIVGTSLGNEMESICSLNRPSAVEADSLEIQI